MPGTRRKASTRINTTQYLRQEAIATSDTRTIEGRWMYGLRLLHDPRAFAPGSSQLRPGVSEDLVATAKAAGLKLSEREIRYRMECARAYSSEAQIRHACAEFPDWVALRSAGFPPVEVAPDEPPADWRTDAERRHDQAAALIALIGNQGALFSLRDFEPTTSTLSDLTAYADEQDQLTDRFVAHGRKRRQYLDQLVAAAAGDLTMTWIEAHERIPQEAT